MDQLGDGVRKLINGGGFNRQKSDEIAQYRTECRQRNLRGKCANPNVLDADGQAMSWDDYDMYKAKGIDPRSVHESGIANVKRRIRDAQLGGRMGASMAPPPR